MSKKPSNSSVLSVCLVVLDTSYLLELFRVPKDRQDAAFEPVFQRFARADGVNTQLYIPLPVLFELGNHIADVKDGGARHRLAGDLVDAVQLWLSGESPFTIVSSMDDARTVEDFCSALSGLTEQFAQLAPNKHGLTNTAVVQEALRLKRKNPSSTLKQVHVHIWTRDKRLKALEPDAEANAFV